MEINSEKQNSNFIKFTAVENGKIIGRAYLFIILNDFGKGPYGFIEDVFVEEGNRGKGVGSKLVNSAIEEAKKQNCYKIICTSRYEKPEVHSLYQKLGFKDHGKEFRIDLR